MTNVTTEIRVGALFGAGITRYPEMSHYAWDPIGHAPQAHHRFVMFASRPSAAEMTAFRAGGRVELAFVADGPALVFLFAGAGWPWSDAPYSWHLQAASHRKAGRGEMGAPDVADVPPGSGVPLDLFLVDAATGVLRAMRRVAMEGAFATALHRAIAAQAAAPWDERAYDAKVKALASVDCDALVARAAARCKVGGGA